MWEAEEITKGDVLLSLSCAFGGGKELVDAVAADLVLAVTVCSLSCFFFDLGIVMGVGGVERGENGGERKIGAETSSNNDEEM